MENVEWDEPEDYEFDDDTDPDYESAGFVEQTVIDEVETGLAVAEKNLRKRPDLKCAEWWPGE